MSAKKDKNSRWIEIRRTLSKCLQRDLLGFISKLYSLTTSNKDFLEARFLCDNMIF